MDKLNDKEKFKPKACVFSVPHSNFEILSFSQGSGEYLGVAYRPNMNDVPYPWHSNCPHCQSGRQFGLDITVKRAIQVVMSKTEVDGYQEYIVPTNNEPSHLLCLQTESGLQVRINRQGQDPVIRIWKKSKFIPPSSNPIFSSRVFIRSVRLIASSSEPNSKMTHSILMPLLLQQRKEGIDKKRRFPCCKIDWASVALSL